MNRNESFLSNAVHVLLVVNIACYLLQNAFSVIGDTFALNPIAVRYGWFWQLFTYMFLHGGIMHIFWNMFALVLFGKSIEYVWGRRRFVIYYFFCGVGAGLAVFLISLFTGSFRPTVGASGAIFGLMLAYAVLFPNDRIVSILTFFIPVRAKYLIVIYAGLELYLEVSGKEPDVSHIGHLGGVIFGILFIVLFGKEGSRPMGKFRRTVAVTEKKIEREREVGRAGMRERILLKLRAGGGKESLDDEEWQYVHYLDIISSSGSISAEESVFMTEVRGMMEL